MAEEKAFGSRMHTPLRSTVLLRPVPPQVTPGQPSGRAAGPRPVPTLAGPIEQGLASTVLSDLAAVGQWGSGTRGRGSDRVF